MEKDHKEKKSMGMHLSVVVLVAKMLVLTSVPAAVDSSAGRKPQSHFTHPTAAALLEQTLRFHPMVCFVHAVHTQIV